MNSLEIISTRTEEENDEFNDYLSYSISIPPIGDKIKKYFYIKVLKDSIRFLHVLCKDEVTSFYPKWGCGPRGISRRKFNIEYMLEKLEITTEKNLNTLSHEHLEKLIFSDKFVDLSKKNIEMIKLISHQKINSDLCSVIPNLTLIKVDYGIISNSYPRFYFYGHPSMQIKICLIYNYTLFQGNETPEEIEKINNHWRIYERQKSCDTTKNRVFEGPGKKFRRFFQSSDTENRLVDVGNTIKKIFDNNDMSNNFLQYDFDEKDFGEISPQFFSDTCILREWDRPCRYTNPVYNVKNYYYSYDLLEVPYTPVVYEIKIIFQRTHGGRQKSPSIEKIPNDEYCLENVLDMLGLIDLGPDHKKSHLHFSMCNDCRLLKRCNQCYECSEGRICDHIDCNCNIPRRPKKTATQKNKK